MAQPHRQYRGASSSEKSPYFKYKEEAGRREQKVVVMMMVGSFIGRDEKIVLCLNKIMVVYTHEGGGGWEEWHKDEDL